MHPWKQFLPLLLCFFPVLSSAQQHILDELNPSVSEEFSVHKHFLDLYKDFDLKNPYQTVRGGEVFQPLDLSRKSTLLNKEVFGYMPYWFRDRWNLVDYDLVSTIAYFSGEALDDGTIDVAHGWPRYQGDPSTSADVLNLINSAHANGVRVVLCITTFSGSEINTIVSTPSVRETLIQTALTMVMAANGDGVNINFEGIFNSSRDNLTAFMRALADTFHTRLPGSQVSCAPTDFDTRPGDWDIAAIEPFIDLFFFQGYGYHYRGGPTAGPVGLLPNNTFWGSLNITTLIDFVLSRIDTTKVVLGAPHFGYRWPTSTSTINSATTGSGVAFYYPDALGFIATHGRQWDPVGLNPWYRYQVGAQWYQGWYDESEYER